MGRFPWETALNARESAQCSRSMPRCVSCACLCVAAGLIVSLGDHQVELNRIGVTWICSPSQVPADVRFHFHNDWEKEHNTSPVSPRSIVVPLRQEQLPHSHTLIRIGNSSNISCTSTKRGSATYMVVAANSSRPARPPPIRPRLPGACSSASD